MLHFLVESTRSREGSDTLGRACTDRAVSFNSRSREGSDGALLEADFCITRVSIHAPARGATVSSVSSMGSISCFNSRSREGSNFTEVVRPRAKPVSIHAPARGATTSVEAIGLLEAVSIHAPARGATISVKRLSFFELSFNSRSREGSDTYRRYTQPDVSCFNSRSREGSDKTRPNVVSEGYIVSIQAPARGATTLKDWIIEALLVKGPIAHELLHLTHLLPCPLSRPGDRTLSGEDIYTRDVYALNLANVVEDRVAGNEVAHHNKSPSPAIEGTEESLPHPLGEPIDTILIEH